MDANVVSESESVAEDEASLEDDEKERRECDWSVIDVNTL